jgi:hypothetical protein
VGTAEHTDALTRRIEQLAAAALDEGDGAALAALIAALRSEIGAVRVDVGSLRSETGGLRTDLDGLEARLVASVDAGKRETTSLLRRFAGELDETVTSALDAAARPTRRPGRRWRTPGVSWSRGWPCSRTCWTGSASASRRSPRRCRHDDRAPARARRDRPRRRRAAHRPGAQSAEQVVDRLTELVETRVAASEQRLTEALEAAGARAAEDRAVLQEMAATAGVRLSAMTEVLDRTLSGLQATSGEQQAASPRSPAGSPLGEELAGRLAELATVVDERTTTLRTDVTERLVELEGAMGSFRAEWPTRTFEVVQGAKAVAEGSPARCGRRSRCSWSGCATSWPAAWGRSGTRARGWTLRASRWRRPAGSWSAISSSGTGCWRPSVTGCCTTCSTASPPGCPRASAPRWPAGWATPSRAGGTPGTPSATAPGSQARRRPSWGCLLS